MRNRQAMEQLEASIKMARKNLEREFPPHVVAVIETYVELVVAARILQHKE